MEFKAPPRPHTVGGPLPPRTRVQSDFIAQLLQEIESEARGPVAKPKPPQKNHMKENVRRLKEIEAQVKQRMEERQPMKVPHKHYEGQSKVTMTDRSLPRLPPRTAGVPRTTLTQPLQPCRSLPQLNRHDDAAQVFEEHCTARELESVRSDSGSDVSAACSKKKSKSERRHRPGQIPNYLLERRREWEAAERERRREEEEAVVPEGFTLLPDEERTETLELLKKNREELIQSLSSLPVRSDTVRLRSRKEELERQLAKVEEGIRIFSRPKVLIKHDT